LGRIEEVTLLWGGKKKPVTGEQDHLVFRSGLKSLDPFSLFVVVIGDKDPNSRRSIDGEGMLLGGLAIGIDGGLVEVDVTLWLGRALIDVVEKNLIDQDTVSLLPVLDDASLFREITNLHGVLDLISRDVGEGKLD
jgi:hypothetical protein